MTADGGDVTRLITAVRQGEDGASAELFQHVYRELRQLAARHMRGERHDHTLQPTALVHEAYMKLTGQRELSFENRAHFFGVAAGVMRRILIDHARAVRAEKRGRGDAKVPVDDILEVVGTESPDYLIELDQALDRLAALDDKQARVVELRYFGGLSVEETAEVMGVTSRTINRHWRVARAWLHRELTQQAS
jgi:RNA polymerase sigma-70 factor, ECF subfamily